MAVTADSLQPNRLTSETLVDTEHRFDEQHDEREARAGDATELRLPTKRQRKAMQEPRNN
jgi:hypothetical protein